jgi:hypothetical protein
MPPMTAVDEILAKARELPPEDQERIVRELTRDRLIRRLQATEAKSTDQLPISDEELNQLVHEARREVLRAHGL